MQFEINPHIGIGPVKLGMSREEVKAALGAKNHSHSEGELDYYFENAFQIEFVDNKADFIGVSDEPDYTVTYEGVNVFDTQAKKLFEIINANEDQPQTFDGYECLFLNQIITLWDADEQYDRMGAESRKVWAQIGVGSKNYLQAVLSL